jgi:hypothetical protein
LFNVSYVSEYLFGILNFLIYRGYPRIGHIVIDMY